MTDRDPPYVAVIGAGDATSEEITVAEEVGRLLAEAGAVLVCGGLGGVMEAAARGCVGAGGAAVGILPGDDRSARNPHLTIAISTGLGEARNAVIVRSADSVIAVGGGFGTLSEMALALRMGRQVIGLSTWSFSKGSTSEDPVIRAGSPTDAVQHALLAARRSHDSPAP